METKTMVVHLVLSCLAFAGGATALWFMFRPEPRPRWAHDGDKKGAPWVHRVAARLGPRAIRYIPDGFMERLVAAFLLAGEPWDLDRRGLAGMVCLGVFVGIYFLVMIAVVVSPMVLVLFPVFGLLGAYVPLIDLRQKAAHRKVMIENALPWMLELVVLALNSGATLEDALDAYLTCGDRELVGEIKRILGALRYGATRETAFGEFGQRCPYETTAELVRQVQSHDKLGVPIATALAEVSGRLRESTLRRIETEATIAQARMVGPLVLMGGAFFVVILAPFFSTMLRGGMIGTP